MSIQNKKIAIVGGGPGGLTLARLLQLSGADVSVYERDFNAAVRVQGATLDLHEESGLEALRRAGLIDSFYANYRPDAHKMRILNKNLEIKMDGHTEEDQNEGRPEIDRGPLRKILLESLKPDTVIWDSQFVSMEASNGGWKLLFKNGKTAEADIVIAADGANSRIRPYITEIKPVYSGVSIVEGNVYHAGKNSPKLYGILNGGKIFAFGDEKSLILSAKGDGSISFYTGCKTDEFWINDSGIDFNSKEQVFEWFKNEFRSWDDAWQELFESDEVSFVPRPQYHFPLDQQWDVLPNLTMIGDAAHRMPPYAGEGVNMAMQDAFELAACFLNENFAGTQAAIGAFETQMCARASRVTRETLDSTEMLHSDDAADKLIQLFSQAGDNTGKELS